MGACFTVLSSLCNVLFCVIEMFYKQIYTLMDFYKYPR